MTKTMRGTWRIVLLLGLLGLGGPGWGAGEQQPSLSPQPSQLPAREVPGCRRSANEWQGCLEAAKAAYAQGETDVAYLQAHWGIMADGSGRSYDDLSDPSPPSFLGQGIGFEGR